MSFSIGNNVKYSIFGESHGHCVGMCIDGLPAGIRIDYDLIEQALRRRRPSSKYTTKRVEKDEITWLSGITNGFTNGGNLCFCLENKNIHSSDYDEFKHTPRPSHADYPAMIKYHSFHDGHGGGFFSARLTSALVVAGSIVNRELIKKGIKIYAYIDAIGEINFTLDDYKWSFENHSNADAQLSNQNHPYGDVPFSIENHPDTDAQFSVENHCNTDFSLIDHSNILPNSHLILKEDKKQMLNDYLNNNLNNDAFGGRIKLICENMPIGIGEPFFDSVESVLSHYLFSIPALKNISFGIGEEFKRKKASEIMERLKLDEEGNIRYTTNYNGGILGGLTNGNPIVVNLGFRAASSIAIPQETVDLQAHKNTMIEIRGRHDRAFILRTPVICESVAAMALYDLLLSNQKFKR